MENFFHEGSFKIDHAQSNTGRTHFKKGHIPWSKDKEGIHLSPGSEFKKGNQTNNRLPVGTAIKRKCKGNVTRIFIKIAEPSKWIGYASFVWIQKNGEIQKGYFLHHKDGNPLNDSIKNLQLVTRKEHCKIHNPGKR